MVGVDGWDANQHDQFPLPHSYNPHVVMPLLKKSLWRMIISQHPGVSLASLGDVTGAPSLSPVTILSESWLSLVIDDMIVACSLCFFPAPPRILFGHPPQR